MAIELEWWTTDGPDGECLDFARRVAAWEILPAFQRYTCEKHVALVLRHTSRHRPESWLIWVRADYASGTFGGARVGKLQVGKT